MPNAISTGNYSSAVIGLDAQFVNHQGVQTDIDRVERALYLGKGLGDGVDNQQELSFESCQQAVTRMAQANQLQCSDINIIIITEDQTKQQIDFQPVTLVNSLAKALEQLDLLLKQNKLVALVGLGLAQTFTGSVADSSDEQTAATISFDQGFTGYQNCNGVAALLFSSVEFAKINRSYVYAWLKGFAGGDDVSQVTTSALAHAQVTTNDIGLLEVSALADHQPAMAEQLSLITSYASSNKLTTAITCARSLTGEGGGFSQVLGLLRTVIALQQRYIPAISDWQQPAENQLRAWQTSSFYCPTESRPWYPHADGSAHLAAYSCLSSNNDYCHIVLEEHKITVAGEKHAKDDIRHNGFIACSELQMVLVSANSQQNLLAKLIELERNQASIKTIALSCFTAAKAIKYSYTIALLCESKAELLKEIQSAKSGIAFAFEQQKEWRTPKGSFFTSTPVNQQTDSENDSNVAFLYPGIGATYIGLGRDLFHLFPEIHQDVANLADDIGASLKDSLLNPRTIVRPDFNALKQLDLNLRGNLADIAEAGVGFACVFTKVFENVFKVKADYATGYSMGEVSMYAALGAWQQPGLMSARLAKSDTFNQRLCGDLLTLREHWDLASGTESMAADETIWETYTIKATLEQVLKASEGEERVYCTIINTPDSLLIAGYPTDCLRVIKNLGVRAMALNMANAIHSAPANIEYNDMVELYTMAVTPRLTTKMYSSSCYLPVPQLSKAIAHSVAKCLCDRVDFPRLINTLHDKGARVFIEMGPGRSLCSWVDKILDFDKNGETKSRIAVPVNAKGTSDELTYLRAIAKLISHGVKLDIDSLFNGTIVVKKQCA